MLAFLNPFAAKTPSFQAFILAAQQVGPRDSLVLKRERLVRKLPLEAGEESLNRATWSAFAKAVENSFSPSRRQRICELYKFDWKKMIHSNFPFERRYIEYFGVGACSVSTNELKNELYNQSWFGDEDLSSCSPERIHALYTDAIRGAYLGQTHDPKNLHGAPVKGHENFTRDRFLEDGRRCNLFRGVSGLVSPDPNVPLRHPYYSRLIMAISSLLETDEKKKDTGIVIPAPGEKDGEVEYYEVYDIISRGGLNAFALVPISKTSSLKPLLIFRCTKQGIMDGIPSWLNDMEKKIGNSGYVACKEKFNKLMEDKNFTRGGKIIAVGYSLGGAHAGYFMKDHWKNVKECVCFNYVGNVAKVIEELSEEINALPKDAIPPAFYLHRNLGDWANNTGQKHLGWGVHHPNGQVHLYEWDVDDLPRTKAYVPTEIPAWLNIHGARPMDAHSEDKIRRKSSTRFPYRYTHSSGRVCDSTLDTYKRDSVFEDLRRAYGHKILFNVVSFFYSISDFILRVLGIEFFKKNL